MTIPKGAKISVNKKAFKKSNVKTIELTISKKAKPAEINKIKAAFTKAGIKTKNIKIKKK